MFNDTQLAVIKRALTALAEREMHLNNVVSDEVTELLEELSPEPVVQEAPVEAVAEVVETPAEAPVVEEQASAEEATEEIGRAHV